MSLPILQGTSHATSQPTPQTLVRLFHQTELNWSRHLAQEQVLDFGTALFNAELPGVAQANRILDATFAADVPLASAITAAEAFYQERGSNLLELIPRPGVGSDALKEFLTGAGWSVHQRAILRLSRRPAASPLTIPSDIKIIPARASFRHARDLAEEMTARDGRRADAAVMHLDDPHVDALLALLDGRAVAGIAVLAMGEVGRIDQLFVSAGNRRTGLGRIMLSRALEICARALLRHVLLSVSMEEIHARALFEGMGFEMIGSIDSFQPRNNPD